MRIIMTYIIALFSVIPVSIGESLSTIILKSSAPINIDGDFSDWAGYDVKINEIKHLPNQRIMRDYKFKPPSSNNDLFATFSCFGDAEYIYFKIDVKDNICVFGEEPKNRPSWDDVIEIIFFNDANESMGKLWLSAGLNGKTELRGREPITNIFPYSWESQGVSATLNLHKNGYKTELAIPYNALSFLDIRNTKQLKINIRVYDDDGKGDPDSMLSWAKSDKLFNIIRFSEE